MDGGGPSKAQIAVVAGGLLATTALVAVAFWKNWRANRDIIRFDLLERMVYVNHMSITSPLTTASPTVTHVLAPFLNFQNDLRNVATRLTGFFHEGQRLGYHLERLLVNVV
jgi:hypothetical protein